jgi:class 3 adenylate cyclase
MRSSAILATETVLEWAGHPKYCVAARSGVYKPFYHQPCLGKHGTIMPDGERRLAAIMYTDIVGYTALTQKDESSTLQALERHRSLLRPIFSSHAGREIKTIGDAFLVEFQSALDAVLCAVAVQQMMHDRKVARGEPLSLRIGIHIGDVVESGSDILGDAVNVASRIEPMADSGGICISEQVYDQVRNKVRVPLVKAEPAALKGVSIPIEIYKVRLPWARTKTTAQGDLDRRTISVGTKPIKSKPFVRQTLGKIIQKMTMKNRIIVAKLTNDPSIPALLARFSEEVDYGRSETFHVVSAGETVTVVIDSKNLDKLKRIIPKKSVLGIYQDLAEITITGSEEALYRPGGVATVSGELARNGISIFEFFTSAPAAIILVSEKQALRSYQLLQRLSSS